MFSPVRADILVSNNVLENMLVGLRCIHSYSTVLTMPMLNVHKTWLDETVNLILYFHYFSAKYGCYRLLEVTSKKIITINLI